MLSSAGSNGVGMRLSSPPAVIPLLVDFCGLGLATRGDDGPPIEADVTPRAEQCGAARDLSTRDRSRQSRVRRRRASTCTAPLQPRLRNTWQTDIISCEDVYC
eukprot:scaffold400615_cov28-Prasinocladus_malaysianus.AAC.1